MRELFIDNLWRWSCNMAEVNTAIKTATYDELEKTEWSNNFEQLMRNRLMLGAFRYGRLSPQNQPKYNRVESIKRRVDLYSETGNLEYLVDAANFAMVEFIEGKHPLRHMAAVDDGEHARETKTEG